MSDIFQICILSLGHRHITAMIAEIREDESMFVQSVYRVDSVGIRGGKVVEINELCDAIKRVVSHVENQTDCRVDGVWLCISHPDMVSQNCVGEVVLGGAQITTEHICDAFTKAKSQILEPDSYVVSHRVQGTELDYAEPLKNDPIGMHADVMRRYHHVMTLPVLDFQNLQSVMHRAGYRIDRLVFSQFASGEYALLEEERQGGVCVVDIGHETTSIAVFVGDALVHSACLPVGAGQVTADISTILNIPTAQAEKLKHQRGTLDLSTASPTKNINLSKSKNSESVTHHKLALIINARYREILIAVFQELADKESLGLLKHGLVYCGGGSRMSGFAGFTQGFTGQMTHIANFPEQIKFADELTNQLNHFSYQSVCGTLKYSQSKHHAQSVMSEEAEQHWFSGFVRFYQRLVEKLRLLF